MKIAYGDGVTDDTEAIQALIDGERVCRPDGREITSGTYLITKPIEVKPQESDNGELIEETEDFLKRCNKAVLMSSEEQSWKYYL